jgi:hypothetical protein
VILDDFLKGIGDLRHLKGIGDLRRFFKAHW